MQLRLLPSHPFNESNLCCAGLRQVGIREKGVMHPKTPAWLPHDAEMPPQGCDILPVSVHAGEMISFFLFIPSVLCPAGAAMASALVL